MEEVQGTPNGGFIGTPASKILGLVLRFVIPFVMLMFGVYRYVCLFVFIGVIMFIVPKLFGVKDIKAMAAMGLVFFVAAMLIGTFAFTIPDVKNNQEDTITGDFSHVEIVETGDTYAVHVTYTGTQTGTMKLYYGPLSTTAFHWKGDYFVKEDPLEMTPTGSGSYTYSGLKMDSGKPYAIYFEIGTDDSHESSDTAVISANISSNDIRSFALKGNGYYVGIITVMFFLILILTTLMRRSLEKTRARLEAEGRLYPQGYGRCKECGMLVLPGETVCRKCGAYIDIPDEIKAKMKQKVEYTECSECGAEIPSDARRCPKCGAVFDEDTEEVVIAVDEEQMSGLVEKEERSNDNSFECSECGARIPADAKKCPQCGAEFDEDE